MKYRHVVLGGTFDHLHRGHERMLSLACSLGEHITIGLTTAPMVASKAYAYSIQDYQERLQALLDSVESLGRRDDVTVVPLTDVYGTTLTDTTLEAIILTEQTLPGGHQINSARVARGMEKLPFHICELERDTQGEIISSTRIRAGEIDRTGYRYTDIMQRQITISDQARQVLKEPLGPVADNEQALAAQQQPVIVVGDYITQSCMDAAIPFQCGIVDGFSERKPFTLSLPVGYHLVQSQIVNAPGTIDPTAVQILDFITGAPQQVVMIAGEEDLLAAVAIMLSPLHATVAYGNPYGEGGIVTVLVTEERKGFLRSILIS